MKAVRLLKYGAPGVLSVEHIKIPVPRKYEVLVKNVFTSINPVDAAIRRGTFAFVTSWRKPYVLGCDFAGEVVKVGTGVQTITVGQRVFGCVSPLIGGTYAEYLCVPEKYVCILPSAIDLKTAACLATVGLTALSIVKRTKASASSRMLVNNSSGGVGTALLQIAKRRGIKTTAVTSFRNLELCARLGASNVIDYTKTNLTTLGYEFDSIVDLHGNRSMSNSMTLLNEHGILIQAVLPRVKLSELLITRFAKEKVVLLSIKRDRRLLDELVGLVGDGSLSATIDTIYPLDQIAEAHRLIETGHVKGKIVISI